MNYEAEFWGMCENTHHEETKQFVYASRMGLLASNHGAHPPTFNIGGRSVVDIGGGPVSLLLKCVERGRCAVVDPGEYPAWVFQRYWECGIEYICDDAENFVGDGYDECWIYNVLQHVKDPALVISNARKSAKVIRIFEWLDIEPYEGHPHMLTSSALDEWLEYPGFSVEINESGAVGHAYYSVVSTTTGRKS